MFESRPFAIHKYQALGNDMLVVDPARFDLPLSPAAIRLICDRHFGVGADGICYGPLDASDPAFAMRFFNPDGSEAEKSGNGLRIFARYLVDAGYVKAEHFTMSIQGARAEVERLDETGHRFAITMGQVSFLSSAIPMCGPEREVVAEEVQVGEHMLRITGVNVGNPHCVHFTSALETIQQLGPLLENAPLFPQRTNVQFVQVLDEHAIRIAIWERGAGYTLASGTSACASAAAAVRGGGCASPVTVHMDGGTAIVSLDQTWQARLTGSVAAVFHGQLSPDLLSALSSIAP